MCLYFLCHLSAYGNGDTGGCAYMCWCVCVFIFQEGEREREREIETDTYTLLKGGCLGHRSLCWGLWVMF